MGKCSLVPAGSGAGTVHETDALLEPGAPRGWTQSPPAPDTTPETHPDPEAPRGEAAAAPATSLAGWHLFLDQREDPGSAESGHYGASRSSCLQKPSQVPRLEAVDPTRWGPEDPRMPGVRGLRYLSSPRANATVTTLPLLHKDGSPLPSEFSDNFPFANQ